MKALSGVLLTVIAVAAVHGQDKPTAIKISEFVSSRQGIRQLDQITKQFIEELSKQPITTKGIVISYPELLIRTKCNGEPRLPDRGAEIIATKVILQDRSISSKRVAVVVGNPRPYSVLEFWLVPKEAEMPKPVEFEYDPGYCCANLIVDGPVSAHTGDVLSFSTHLEGIDFANGTKFSWSVSAGKIVSGQRTRAITVILTDREVREVTASVTISFNPTTPCPTMSSFTTNIVGK
jgi:hypothetical protein